MATEKNPLRREWDKNIIAEKKFLRKGYTAQASMMEEKLDEMVPEKLQSTLDKGFSKAFTLIFEKGTAIIEKTYNKEKLLAKHMTNEFMLKQKTDRRNLKASLRETKGTGRKNVLISGVAGVGMGALGVGIPDIPVFVSMLLKNIYEISQRYGFDHETEEEQYFILMIIKGALSHGEELMEVDGRINQYIREGRLPEDYSRKTLIEETSKTMSGELLYMKFLQGIPVVGAVGGAYDAIYMDKVSRYAQLKYRRRYLRTKIKGEEIKENE